MYDGYFSASHQHREGQEEETSPLEDVFYHPLSPELEGSINMDTGCTSNFVAARNNASTNKRNDINGIFGSMCNHGCMEDIYGMLPMA